jgi:hypothetical protein
MRPAFVGRMFFQTEPRPNPIRSHPIFDPMNKVLSLVQAARTCSDPRPVLCSDEMLSELLAVHEDMIAQLCLERLEAVGNANFLTGMIDQHESTAAMLRTKLKQTATDISLEQSDHLAGVVRRFASTQ